ncbi:MAG: glycosyltransferase family 4 protein [Acidimicrobiales bacterium]
MGDDPVKVLVVGQTPPPFGGQALSIAALLEGSYSRVELHHVRLAFSRDMGEVGVVQLRKAVQLPVLVFRILLARIRTRATVLYYPPTGTKLVPLLRDAVVLICTRWAFPHTVFRFEAGGLAEVYPTLSGWQRRLVHLAYGHPDVAVVLFGDGLVDAELVGARNVVVVHNGVPDDAATRLSGRQLHIRPPVVLFVGVVCESKGVLVLLDALARLHDRGVAFTAHVMGEFQPPAFEDEVRRRVLKAGIEDKVVFLGRKVGEEKWRHFVDADIFCLPTFFEYETFPLVVLEAMAFELPVVATRWRGIPEMVEEGITGEIVDVGDPDALAEHLAGMLSDPARRAAMGRAGRTRYLDRFTVEHYRRGVEGAMVLAAAVT